MQRRDVAEALTLVRQVQRRSGWLATAALVIGLLATWVFGRSVTRPICSLAGTMRRLAEGETGLAVAGRDRRDEIGEMARAVEVFRRGAVERVRLQEDRMAAEARSADRHRRGGLLGATPRPARRGDPRSCCWLQFHSTTATWAARNTNSSTWPGWLNRAASMAASPTLAL